MDIIYDGQQYNFLLSRKELRCYRGYSHLEANILKKGSKTVLGSGSLDFLPFVNGGKGEIDNEDGTLTVRVNYFTAKCIVRTGSLFLNRGVKVGIFVRR
ncbi:hypothetical protein K8R33_02710 [archaeon]|nr:hypothetical protein [archaeon]